MIILNETSLQIMFGLNGMGGGVTGTCLPGLDNVFEAIAIPSFAPPPSGGLEKCLACYNEKNFVSGGLEAVSSFHRDF